MGNHNKRIPAALLLFALAGCATLPTGPSVMVLPAPGKPFETFQSEDIYCRRWAESRSGSAQQNYNDNAVNGATVGTVVGAGIGALLGAASGHAGAGAAIGAGAGLLAGSSAGADSGRAYGYQAQRHYDNSYLQCMYAKGNQIPGTVGRSYRARTISAPPPDYYPVPPDYEPPR